MRWLKTATRSGSNHEEKRKGPPVSPDLPLPDPCAVHPRSTSFSTTSHRTRLPLPQEVREPFTRSKRETASFHKQILFLDLRPRKMDRRSNERRREATYSKIGASFEDEVFLRSFGSPERKIFRFLLSRPRQRGTPSCTFSIFPDMP